MGINLDTGFLAFYNNRSSNRPLLDRLISFVDGSSFTHVEIAIKNRDDTTYTSYSSSAMADGVTRKQQTFDSGHWVLIPVLVNRKRLEELYQIHKYAKYDFIGLLCTKIYWIRDNKNRWFCSEYCAYALDIDRNPSRYGIKKLYNTAKSNLEIKLF